MSRTNILLVTADDLGAGTPGCFGGAAGVTPALDRLASEGVVFHRAHVPIAVCQPSRSAMVTGRWPHRNGAEGFEPIDDGIPLLTDLLRPAGYRVGILGKVNHLEPVSRFEWDYVRQMQELGMGRDPRAYGAATAEFIAWAAEDGRPWFLMANAHDPHRPFHGSDQELERFTDAQRDTIPAPSRVFDAADATPPGFLPDLPQVRRETAEYLGSSRRCDDVVAAVLSAVAASGQAERTLVVFLSDNGMAFPFAKANCYLQSTRTPMIIRWPGKVSPGTAVTGHFVSGLDLLPTFCDAAGFSPPDDIDGRSLVTLLTGGDEDGRDHMVTVFHETSAGVRYEMRCVQDERFGYVWNAWSDGVATYRAENMQGRTWPAMLAAAETHATLAARAHHYLTRAPEELYRLDADPDALTDLSGDPAYADRLAAMRRTMAAWMRDTADPLSERYASVAGRPPPGSRDPS